MRINVKHQVADNTNLIELIFYIWVKDDYYRLVFFSSRNLIDVHFNTQQDNKVGNALFMIAL